MEPESVLIFGKDACPYTQDARDHYTRSGVRVEYFNVKRNPSNLQRMLE